jgi:hypothetical protein
MPGGSPPLSPLDGALVGPHGPVISDGRFQFRVEGLIASGTYGRVALASVVGAEPPVQVALKVYSKDQLIADPWLLDVYDLERRIMVDNTRNDTQWLVQSRGMFGDLWNRYLIMVSFPPRECRGMVLNPHDRCRVGLLPEHAFGHPFRLYMYLSPKESCPFVGRRARTSILPDTPCVPTHLSLHRPWVCSISTIETSSTAT